MERHQPSSSAISRKKPSSVRAPMIEVHHHHWAPDPPNRRHRRLPPHLFYLRSHPCRARIARGRGGVATGLAGNTPAEVATTYVRCGNHKNRSSGSANTAAGTQARAWNPNYGQA